MTQTIDTKVSGKEAVSDKAILSENTPLIQSPLLYTKTDGTQAFVHDTFMEVFLAKYFAAEINSGKLPVGEAYVKYLMVDDFKVREVHGKSESIYQLLQRRSSRENTLYFLVGMLCHETREELLKLVHESDLLLAYGCVRENNLETVPEAGQETEIEAEPGAAKEICNEYQMHQTNIEIGSKIARGLELRSETVRKICREYQRHIKKNPHHLSGISVLSLGRIYGIPFYEGKSFSDLYNSTCGNNSADGKNSSGD